jgi:DNA-binding NarL/FixJ family response regulator
VVTAYDDEEYVRGALDAGAAGHLSKAAPGRELVRAVRAVASGGTVVDPVALTNLLAARGNPSGRPERLSERELDVLRLLAEGLHNKEVAGRLHISRRTVDRHCDNIYAKLGVSSRVEAVVEAISSNLLAVRHGDG